MGVKGLTTYITQRADVFLDNYELHDTKLVIDGLNLAAQLHLILGHRNDSLGGDYDKYRNLIVSFFKDLAECNVTPLVVFDGGYSYGKIATLNHRFQDKTLATFKLNPTTQSSLDVFPLLQVDLFRDVVLSLDLTAITCDFEADESIACIARKLNCPVLSFDSDFFVYNVLYIPFPSLDRTVQTKDRYRFIQCRIYRTEKFLAHFNIKDPLLLVLMSTLLGNDYVEQKHFDMFFASLKLPKIGSFPQRKIQAVAKWLGNETYDTAVNKVLDKIRKEYRPKVKNVIQLSMQSYSRGAENIIRYASTKPPVLNPGETNVVCDPSDYTHARIRVPAKFMDKFRQSRYPTSALNLISKQMLIATPQKEDFKLPSSHTISIDLIQWQFCMLSNQKKFKLKSRVTPMGSKILQIGRISNHIRAFDFLDLDAKGRMKLFTQICDFNDNDWLAINKFPDTWRLHVICIVYWARRIEDIKLTDAHLSAVVLCLIYLQIVDDKIGWIRSPKGFEHKFANRLKRLNSQVNEKSPATNSSLIARIDAITGDDALVFASKFIDYFSIDEKLLTRVNLYAERVVHAFAELQSVTRYLRQLNTLLDDLLPRDCIGRFLNGTFLYNAYDRLKSRNQVDTYVALQTKNASRVYDVYRDVIEEFRVLVPRIFTPVQSEKK